MSVTEVKKKESVDDDEIEIRLSDIMLFFKNSRRVIFISACIALLIGVLYAFSKPNLYSSQVTVLPEIQAKSSSLGGLSSLAGLAGIDINSATGLSTDAIRPDIYPDIIKSVPFALSILEKPVYSRLLGKEVALKTFLSESNKQGILGGLFNSDDDKGSLPDPKNVSKTLQITKEQELLIGRIHESTNASFDKKSGVITVSATLADPVAAATVAQLSLEYLTAYITSYRTEKSRNQVRFLTNQVNEAKTKYQSAEFAISNYRDKNRGLYLNTAKIEEQRLQADYLLSQNVFNELSKQLEQAKIKVAEEAPVFKVLEPARIPLKKSAPKRGFLIIGFTIAGLFIGLGVAIVKLFVNR